MEKTKKHIEEMYDNAENSYYEIYNKLEAKKRELKQIQVVINNLTSDLNKYESDMSYYGELLNELNNEND